MNVNGDKYTLLNLITRREKEYHVRRLHEFHYDPQTIDPLKVACKDDGSKYPVEYIEKMRGSLGGRKENLSFLVHWIGYDEPTWEPWKNVRQSFALYHFLKNQTDERYHRLIPKNINYDSEGEQSESEDHPDADEIVA